MFKICSLPTTLWAIMPNLCETPLYNRGNYPCPAHSQGCSEDQMRLCVWKYIINLDTPIKHCLDYCAIARGVWCKVRAPKALSPRWADDPQSLFSVASRDLVCKAGFSKTTTLESISLNVDECFINSYIISMHLLQKVYIIFDSLL